MEQKPQQTNQNMVLANNNLQVSVANKPVAQARPQPQPQPVAAKPIAQPQPQPTVAKAVAQPQPQPILHTNNNQVDTVEQTVEAQQSVKVEKQQIEIVEQKPTKKRKKSKFLFVASSLFFAAIIVCVFVVMIINSIKDNEKLVLPSGAVVQVVHFGNKYFLEVPEHEVAQYYVFEIKKEDEQEFLLLSTKNKLDVSAYFNQQSAFEVRYYVQKKTEKSRSLPSAKITYVHQQPLTAPILSFDPQTKTLSWNYVENAKKYEFFYASGDQVLSFEVTPTPTQNDEGHGTLVLTLPNGAYQISMIAHPQDAVYYLPSQVSNSVFVEIFSQKQSVDSATYSLSNQKLTIDAHNLSPQDHQFLIVVGDKTFEFNPQQKQNEYEIEFADLGIQIEIGVKVEIVTKGNNAYVLNSPPVQAVAIS